MSDLFTLFRERLDNGLRRNAIHKCSQWAEKYRIMDTPYPGPWTFKYHPWLKKIHDSQAELIVGQKSAQMGYTETALNLLFYNIDILRTDCLYVLPAKTPDSADFSSGRFDPALELSEHLSKLFSDVKNIGHKRAGTTNLYIRGSRSRSGLKSIPVGFVILDEVDEMEQKNIPLVQERMSGQKRKQLFALSTPTLEGYGINELFQRSTMEHFFFKCPSCTKYIELKWPESLNIIAESLSDEDLIRKSYLQCYECKAKLPHETKSEWLENNKWVPSFKGRDCEGYHISQLYSTTVSPADLTRAFFLSQKDPTDETEFYNSKLGLTHSVKDSKISEEEIIACIGGYKSKIPNLGAFTTLGIDVGKFLHCEVTEWQLPSSLTSYDIHADCHAKVIDIPKLKHFEELDRLISHYGIVSVVIDANPERRKAFEFASRFPGLVHLCFYARGINGKQIHVNSNSEDYTISVDRTSWLDLSLGRFRHKTISLPYDLTMEYKQHIMVPTRVYLKDNDGNPVGKYNSGTQDDHYAHARNYSEIALQFALSSNRSTNIDIYTRG